MAIVAVAVAASPTDGGSAFDEAPDAYASMSMRDLRFAPSDLRIDGDRTTAVFVTNDDSFDHSFDIDAMDIHVQIAAGQTKVVMLSPASGETLELYCAVPGHRDGGMVGTVIGR
jgi:uncharacterized cupredoxin-like copper-binding protein